ncbi:MAG: beta-ketoacyl-[acyl-carrier-protein] synthase family protein [Halobacteriovoraceae bacterium]|jgi:3-oxoacyl-[acyl-carrier-protein] synthase II|nr:beta-ketoacyl-[acyl-carrier-protein] synthase family protein [Halobacteriovoraceae bacterium]MBT5095880.1 beta-ketoacyl-[acyl-carrier-protein] synthase family protein [Halobacteriovoraceae bacterium]
MTSRIVITGIGLAAPNGNNLAEFRQALLNNQSGLEHVEIRHMGKVAAGNCHYDETKYQSRKARKRGTRAGATAIYCANEAIQNAAIKWDNVDKTRVGIYIGITEHGNVETENEIHELYQNNLDTSYWSHHHNPRTVANSPAGEVTLNLGITGPAYTIGAACAAGNMGLIQGLQMLQLGEVDLALAGGVSESTHTFGIFAAFKSQGALGENECAELATKPLDVNRNGIAVAEGGAIYTLERLEDALKRDAKIYGEIVGYHTNSDASDFVLPNPERQIECMNAALKRADLTPDDINIVNMHATGTGAGDINECEAVSNVFGYSDSTYINATKGFIGHAMGAAGALELAGNLPAFEDGMVHPCKNIQEIDPKCDLKNLVKDEPIKSDVKRILNNSFGMLGINSSLIVQKYIK